MILSALRKFQIKLSLNSKNGEIGIIVRNPCAPLSIQNYFQISGASNREQQKNIQVEITKKKRIMNFTPVGNLHINV